MLASELNREWARKIIERWDRGEFPTEWHHPYRLACKALGVEPKPHPDKVKKEKYRADIYG